MGWLVSIVDLKCCLSINTALCSSFDASNKFRQIDDGPIRNATIVELDLNSGAIIDSWGQDLFYLPHGLSFDSSGNMWLTDVALHQVFKFGTSRVLPLLTLGQRFEPGSDERHFCKPTSVAVDSQTNDFYVADGYCNSRVVRFSSSGKFIRNLGFLPSTG